MSIQLAVGCHFLQNHSLMQQLLQQLSSSPKSIVITQQKCECDSHQLSYVKLNMVSSKQTTANSLFRIKIWQEGDRPSPIQLKGHHFNFIVRQNFDSYIDLGDSKTTIILSQLQELRELLLLSVFELDKRCKLEYQLRKSHERYELLRKKEKVKEMALAYFELKCAKEMKSFMNFMRFNTKAYLSVARRFFTLWVIQRYEQGLQKLNDEIVQSSSTQTLSQKALIKRCFSGWKQVFLKQQRD